LFNNKHKQFIIDSMDKLTVSEQFKRAENIGRQKAIAEVEREKSYVDEIVDESSNDSYIFSIHWTEIRPVSCSIQ